MIDMATIGPVIEQYEKHGWKLRRALLSADADAALVSFLRDGGVRVSPGLDALWFSRRSKPDSESWELRTVTGSPFALVAVLPTTADAEELEATLAQVELEMRERTIA